MPEFLLMPAFAASEEFQSSSDVDIYERSRDPEMVATCCEAVERWRSLIVEVVQGHAELVRAFFSGHNTEVGGDGEQRPEDEIDLWGKAEVRLGVHLQLSTKPVQLILRLLEVSENSDALRQRSALLDSAADLERDWSLSTDAVRYLSALTPYTACLREISQGRSLSDSVDTLHPLYGALRMVWTCSAAYGAEGGNEAAGRFFGLLQRIASLVVEGARYHLRALLPALGRDMVVRSAAPTRGEASRTHREQKQLVLHAADVCTTLKEQYYKVKLDLEDTRAPWDFSQDDLLFDSADYCYERTAELLSVLDSINERHQRYTELKAAGHKQAALINVTLEDARQLFVGIKFDWLCPTQLERWQLSLETFRGQMAGVDRLAEQKNTERPGSRNLVELYKSLERTPEPRTDHANYALSNAPLKAPSPTLILSFAFNPPEVSIIGPLREGTVEALSDVLPRAFTTTTSRELFGKGTVPKFVKRRVGDENSGSLASNALPDEMARGLYTTADGEPATYWYMSTDAHFCSDQTGQSMVFLTILDALEREGSWRLHDTHAAYLPLSGGGYKAYHKFFFNKRKSQPGNRVA
eukprot:Hpha_TRINITY_DN16411_c2_g9::TRINITY_DN16411_c2_g9_i1::g.161681::m.161681